MTENGLESLKVNLGSLPGADSSTKRETMADTSPHGERVRPYGIEIDWGETDDDVEPVDATRCAAGPSSEKDTTKLKVPSGASGAGPARPATGAFAPIPYSPRSGEGVAADATRTETELVVERSAQLGAKSPQAKSTARSGTVSVSKASSAPVSVAGAVTASANVACKRATTEVLRTGKDSEIPAENDAMADVPAAGNGDGDPQRTERVVIGARYCVPPCTYDEIDVNAIDKQTKYAMAHAPWFEKDVISVLSQRDEDAANGSGPGADGTDLLAPYLNARGLLPGELPRGVLRKWWWCRAFCAADRDLSKEGNAPLHVLREEFAMLALKGLRRLLTRDLMEEEVSDLFVYRTRGEMAYVESLEALEDQLVTSWADASHADGRALLFS